MYRNVVCLILDADKGFNEMSTLYFVIVVHKGFFFFFLYQVLHIANLWTCFSQVSADPIEDSCNISCIMPDNKSKHLNAFFAFKRLD